MRYILVSFVMIVLVSTCGCSTYNTATRGGQFFGTGAVAARGMDVASEMCESNGQQLPCSMTAVSTPHGAAVSTTNGGYYGYPYGGVVPYAPGMPLGGSTGNVQLDGVMLYHATHPGVPYNQVANDLAVVGTYQGIRQADLTQAAVAGNSAAVYDLRADVNATDASVRRIESDQAATAATVRELDTDLARTATLTGQSLRELTQATVNNRTQVDHALKTGVLLTEALEEIEASAANDSPPAPMTPIQVTVPNWDQAKEEE